jgi:F-type H+-transporting ATPase subunit epsilon
MAPTFQLHIATPEKEVFAEDVTGVTVSTVDGELTILGNHLPIVTALKAGELIIRNEEKTRPFAIGGGFLEMDGTKMTILADTAERADDIDEQRVKEAIARAEQIKHEKGADHVEFASMAAKLERDLARLHVVRKHRHMGHHGITQEAVRPE